MRAKSLRDMEGGECAAQESNLQPSVTESTPKTANHGPAYALALADVRRAPRSAPESRPNCGNNPATAEGVASAPDYDALERLTMDLTGLFQERRAVDVFDLGPRTEIEARIIATTRSVAGWLAALTRTEVAAT
jgi:hypothetical protein